jgi:hypothetical protein
MILVDLNQVMISNLMVHLVHNKQVVDEELVRHMVLNSLRGYKQKFSRDFGELVICCDDKRYWRREVFPHYKANRKKDREASGIDWSTLFDTMAKIKEELREHMPYKVVQVSRAEADDVIASLCHYYGKFINSDSNEPILILSGDKDFAQLQKYANVHQYAPIQKKMLPIDNPERFRREHIMVGDRGDGVPNFMTEDDALVAGRRQRPLSRKKIEEWCNMEPEQFCDDAMLRGYKRNQMMVDLDLVPEDIQQACIETYEQFTPASRSAMMPYFMAKRLRQLTESISDF